ncbi:TauD-domain-containing protein [Ascobolus immersus RN42]|uniref:TauD-domain-containing protein n=1 Tax=Ascobolus immersus RN42 TaxID=1160509 RepID=A0A3N4HP02_ASCIM|nr:TauD-domain-containing protein [Ascobolus immersus RN42]
MAPSIILTEEVKAQQQVLIHKSAYKEFDAGSSRFAEKTEKEGGDGLAPATYPHYLPVWEDEHFEPLQPFEHYDHGKDADPTFPNLLKDGVQQKKLTPHFGSEIRGIQLSSLTKEGKDELALFVAKRGVVAFRDQDFADLPIEKALEFGGYFGRHHIHPTSGAPKGFPEVHLVHRSAGMTGKKDYDDYFANRCSSVAWHSDVTYEEQPPGTTFLYALDIPNVDGHVAGGDTLFCSQVQAYNRLSDGFKERLKGLKAVHSGHEQAEFAKVRGGVVRRDPVSNTHPVVRTHPVTGEKALFVNQQFTRYIEGFKKEESEYLLKFLFDHQAYGADFHARVKWEPKTVVVWDNRVALHSALLDFAEGQRRHMARITPQAERPTEEF